MGGCAHFDSLTLLPGSEVLARCRTCQDYLERPAADSVLWRTVPLDRLADLRATAAR